MALSMTRYNPTARAGGAATVSLGGRSTAGQYPGGGNNHQYDNHDGPVRPGGDPRGDTIDYGPSNGPSQQERIDAAWKKWGGSGLYVNGVEMPWAHGPDQERGMRAPFFTPDVLDPRNAGYFAGGTSPEQEAARMNARNSRYADTYSGNMQDSSFASSADTLRQFGIDVSDPNVRLGELAYKNKNNPALVAAINEHGRQMEIAKRGLSQDYRPPSRSGGPWPAPHAPQSQGGGAPPATVQGGVRRGATPSSGQMNGDAVQAFGKYGPPPQAMPPMQNPMMQGYQSAYPQGGYMGGGAGVPTGSGWGSAGGMPGVPSGGGWGSAGGNPMVSGGADLNRWLAMQGGGNPGASMGGGEMGYMYDQPMMAAQGRTAPWQGLAPGSRQPIGPYQPPQLDPSMRGGGSGWGGMQPGYAPFDAGNYSMPYDMMGMGQWY